MNPTARQALVERLEALHSFLIHEGEETGSGWVVQPGDHQQTVRDVLALLRADEAETVAVVRCPRCRGTGWMRHNAGHSESCDVCYGSGELREPRKEKPDA